MHVRALLAVPSIAAIVLGIGVSGASAATLFTTSAHATRVAVGASWDTTGTVVFTAPPGTPFLRCHAVLRGTVGANNMTTGVALAVTSGTFGCEERGVAPTTFPWTVTVLGNGAASGGNLAYKATLDRISFDIDGIGLFAGNLTSGLTALQPTAGTAPISIQIAGAGGWSTAPIPTMQIDTIFPLTGTAASWSLTN